MSELQNALVVLVLGALVSFSLLVYSFFLVNREILIRRRAENALEHLNDELEHRVQKRTVELEHANDELKAEIARHRHTEEALRQSEQKFSILFEKSAFAASLSRLPDGVIADVNQAFERAFGYTKQEAVGKTSLDLGINPDSEGRARILAALKEHGSARNQELTLHTKSGEVRIFSVNVDLMDISDQKYILNTTQDITERKRAEEQVEQQLRRLQSLRAIDLAILGTTDLHLALKTILEETKASLQVDIAQVELFNPNTMMLETSAVNGNRYRDIEQISVRLGEGIGGKAALERRTIAISNLAEIELSGPLISAMHNEGAHAVYSTPLIAKGVLVGVLNVFLHSPFFASKDWLDFFEALAGQAAMAVDSGKSFEALQRANLDLRLAYDTTIQGWSNALDLRDKETEGHSLRVTEMTMKLARAARITEEELIHVRRGALLHDIGKMGIPDGILLKPDKLTDEEWEIMRKHPTYAYELLSPIAHLRPALDIPFNHHEKWDGSGYPRGLKGEQIPLSARIFAVADVWDALRSDRPYRPGWPEEKVLEYLRSQSGTHFDPQVVELFLRLWSENRNGNYQD